MNDPCNVAIVKDDRFRSDSQRIVFSIQSCTNLNSD